MTHQGLPFPRATTVLTCVNESAKRGKSQEQQPATMPNCSANMYTPKGGTRGGGWLRIPDGVRLCRGKAGERLVKGQSAAAKSGRRERQMMSMMALIAHTLTHSHHIFPQLSLSLSFTHPTTKKGASETHYMIMMFCGSPLPFSSHCQLSESERARRVATACCCCLF